MARTPDRRPGESDEEGIVLENRSSGDDPSTAGGIRYVDGSFSFRDALGIFNPRSAASPGGSNSEVQFNDAGSLSGSANFRFLKSTNTLVVNSLSGSLTRLSDGSPYLVAGNNISLLTGSSGNITISANLSGLLTGSGTAGYLPKWSDPGGLTNSIAYEVSSGLGIGTNSFSGRLFVSGSTSTNVPTFVTRAGFASQVSPIFDVQDNLGTSLFEVSSSLVSFTIPLRGGNGSATSVTYGFDASAGTGMYRGTSGQLLRFAVSNAMVFGVSSTGNVGIGVTATTSPSGRLHVAGETTAGSVTTLLVRHGAAAGSSLPVIDVQDSAGTSLLFVSGSGNVGIGSTSPGAKLFITGSSSSQNPTTIVKSGVPTPTAPIVDVQTSGGTTLFYVSGSGELGLGQNISSIQTSTITTSTISQTTLMTVSSTLFRSAEFIIQGSDTTGGNYNQTKILAIHNGSTSSHTVYGTITIGSSPGTFDVTNPSGGNFLLRVTPSSTNSTAWKVTGILTRV